MSKLTGTTHRILGMAKSALDPKGAKARNLELDFLRLCYAILLETREKLKVTGVLCVLDEGLAQRCAGWKTKYGMDDRLLIHCAELSPEERAELEAEKSANREGNTGNNPEAANADYGEQLGEAKLNAFIGQNFPGVAEGGTGPLGVRWDFVGVVPGKGARQGGEG